MEKRVYKVVLLGNSGVGKTSLFRKLKNGEVERERSITDSIDLAPCTLEYMLSDTLKVQLEINDTGSLEKFRSSIPTNYFRHCQGVVLIYDVSNLTSLYDLEEWISDAHQKTADDPGITYIMIGNKADLAEFDSTSNEGRMFGARHEIPETLQFRLSSQGESHQSLNDIFKKVAEALYEAQTQGGPKEIRTQLSVSLTGTPEVEDKTGRCSRC